MSTCLHTLLVYDREVKLQRGTYFLYISEFVFEKFCWRKCSLQALKQDFFFFFFYRICESASYLSRDSNLLEYIPGGSDGKASVYNAGDLGSIPGLGRSPGEGNGNLLQYYCLENPMDRGAWQATVHGVAKSQTRLTDFTFRIYFINTSFPGSWVAQVVKSLPTMQETWF